MPLANLPMMFAVAGATSSRPMLGRQRDVLDVGVRAARELIGDDRPPRDRLEGHLADELPRRPRHDRGDVVAALLQPARDFDGLVGADAAGDAERDQGTSATRRVSTRRTFSTLPSFTSFCASRTSFSLPVVRGVQPRSSCRARAPATIDELERVRYVSSVNH